MCICNDTQPYEMILSDTSNLLHSNHVCTKSCLPLGKRAASSPEYHVVLGGILLRHHEDLNDSTEENGYMWM